MNPRHPTRLVRTALVLLGLAGPLAACSTADPDAPAAIDATSAMSTTTTLETMPDQTMPNQTMPDERMPNLPNDSAFPRTERLAYGEATQQFGDLTVPAAEPSPVVVLVHGGFWRNPYGLDLMEPLADDLVDRGYAVWNIEYRRLGDEGGGWPGTLADVAAAIDLLASVDAPIDLERVGLVGHSAGGHLALWAAGRDDLPGDAPGAGPAVVPVVAVGQGAVVDLVGAAAARLGNGAVEELLGDTASAVPDRFRWATPSLGAGPTMVSVVGTADDIVPPRFSADAPASGDITVVEIDGADHFDLIDPSHPAWRAVVDQLDATIGTPRP